MNLNLLAISGILLSVTCSFLTIILLIYGRNDFHRLWTLFNSFCIIWGYGLFRIAITHNISQAMYFWKITNTAGIFLAAIFLHIAYVFCGKTSFRSVIVAYVLVFSFSILDIFNLLNYKLTLLYNTFYYIKPLGPQYPLVSITWLLIIGYALYVLFKYYLKIQGFKRNQALYLFAGTLVGALGGATHFLPIFGFNIYPFGQLGIAIYGAIATYAVLRYRILDIRIALTRTGVFIAVYTLILGAPFILAIKYKNKLIELFGSYWWIIPLGLMGLLATIGPFLYIYFQRKAENKIFKEQKRYQSTLKQASVGMTRIKDLKKLLDLIAHIVTKTVRISYAAIYLYDRHTKECVLQISRPKGKVNIPSFSSGNLFIDWLTREQEPIVYEEIKRKWEDTKTDILRVLEENMRLLGAAVIIPSFLENKFMGFFVLGNKVSGQIYTPDDLDVFQVLASQAALAIENAQFYAEVKEMNEQIAQADKMATIGTMADGLSHQINNRFYALSLIAGDSIDTIKLTDTSKCTPEVKAMIDNINYALGRIQTNVIQGGEVVRGLLKYSRKGDEGLEALKLNDIIDNTLEMVQFKVKLNEIDLIREFPEDLPKIKGNMTQLNEAFFNFIDNAYDAIVERRTTLKEPDYRGKITIAAKQISDDYLQIIFQDNGMGIKDDNNRKIFTPFFTTKVSSRKGTGLGLYVIRRIIVESHRGKIEFETEYKKGTRFVLQLPIAK